MRFQTCKVELKQFLEEMALSKSVTKKDLKIRALSLYFKKLEEEN